MKAVSKKNLKSETHAKINLAQNGLAGQDGHPVMLNVGKATEEQGEFVWMDMSVSMAAWDRLRRERVASHFARREELVFQIKLVCAIDLLVGRKRMKKASAREISNAKTARKMQFVLKTEASANASLDSLETVKTVATLTNAKKGCIFARHRRSVSIPKEAIPAHARGVSDFMRRGMKSVLTLMNAKKIYLIVQNRSCGN